MSRKQSAKTTGTPNWRFYKPWHLVIQQNKYWELIFDYDKVRYFTLLETNENEAFCQENELIQIASKATESGDHEAVEDASLNCLELFWPFIHSMSQHRKTESIVRIQLRSIDGRLEMKTHQKPIGDVDHIKNVFPDVKVMQLTQIERLSEMAFQMYKVRVEGSPRLYCLKTVQRHGEYEFFEREIVMLQKCGHHPNVIELSAVVEMEQGKIDGVLLPFINGRVLCDVEEASEEQKVRWKNQITDAVHHLHLRDAVWGDAKPANVMVDEMGNAILFDFEGGYTEGWVDAGIKETKEGDLQAVQRICEFIDNLPACLEWQRTL